MTQNLHDFYNFSSARYSCIGGHFLGTTNTNHKKKKTRCRCRVPDIFGRIVLGVSSRVGRPPDRFMRIGDPNPRNGKDKEDAKKYCTTSHSSRTNEASGKSQEFIADFWESGIFWGMVAHPKKGRNISPTKTDW